MLPTSSVTVTGLWLGCVRAFSNCFISTFMSRRLFQLEVVDSLLVKVRTLLFAISGFCRSARQVHRCCAREPAGGRLDLQQVGAAHQFVDGAHAQLGHVLAQVLSHEAHKVHDVLGLALEPLAQLGVLGGRCPWGRCPDCRRASSRSPWPPAGRCRSRIPRHPAGQAMATSRPLISLPSASMRTRLRRPFMNQASGVPRQCPAPRAGLRCGWSCAAPRPCRRQSRRSG